ncbi:MAG: TIGR00282 family metallophosphoesterase [Alphaproteobacteria bacterium]|nr:TIGR00282 family metallophosphoesterase [Alphaproteobacteria bacterium]
MRIVIIGDVVGRSGRDAVAKYLPQVRERLRQDYTILNGDNAAHGFGITGKICAEFYEMGIDCITAGNHVWDQREILAYINNDSRLLRPLNYPPGTQGNGFRLETLADGRKILIVHVVGRIFMEPLDDPFAVVTDLVRKHPLGVGIHAIVVDFHGEATSEKVAFAHYVDGKVSCVVGTHTHIPTADAQILEKGTAYLTDLGMTGDYDSVIGMQKHTPVQRFVRKVPGERMTPAGGEGTFCGALIVTDDRTGLAKGIEPIRLGPRIQEAWPKI